MKNLILLTHRIGAFSVSAHPQDAINIQAAAINSPARTIFLISHENTVIAYQLDQQKVLFTIPLVKTQTEPQNENESDDFADSLYLSVADSIVSLQYISELECIHLTSSSGRILLLNWLSHELTLVGSMVSGIAACQWSPDRELLVIISRDAHLVLMTNEGDVLYDHLIIDDRSGVLPGQVMPIVRPDSPLVEDIVNISWRGDGQFFVVSMFHPQYDYRRIRVYNRHAEQQSQSYPFPSSSTTGISALIGWRPSGNLITSTQRRIIGTTLKHEIIFFERNGLRHGEFLLRQVESSQSINTPIKSNKAIIKKKQKKEEEDEEEDLADEDGVDEEEQLSSSSSSSASDVNVLDLCWNADSDILALLLYQSSSSRYSVELWSMSNYHWYLKQELNFTLPTPSANSTAALTMCWDPESPLSLVLVSSTGHIHTLSFLWDVSVSSTPPRWAAVVDAATLLLTPLARNIVPPPMSFAALALPCNISAISIPEDPAFRPASYSSRLGFSSHSSSVTPMGILTVDHHLHIIHDIDTIRRSSSTAPVLLSQLDHISVSLLTCGFPVGYLRLMDIMPVEWTNKGAGYRMIAVTASMQKDSVIELVLNSAGEVKMMYLTATPQPTIFLRLYRHYHHQCTYIQFEDGSVSRYLSASMDDANSNPTLSTLSSFPSPCPWFAVNEMGGQLTLIGRDQRSRLYCDATLLTPQCSSFSLSHAAFLAFTIAGSQNAIFFVDLQKSLSENMSPIVRSDPHSFRMVEKGAQIITLIPAIQTPRIVLQMPRGNLESIYPRALTLSSINLALSLHDYHAAFHTMRTNRIDFNLLYDHSPLSFLLHSEEIVKQIKEVDYLNLFLSSLVDRDVKQEEFPNYVAIINEEKENEDNRLQNRMVGIDEQSINNEVDDDVDNIADDHEMEKVKAGLIGKDGREKRGQRLYLDRKAREQAAVEYEAKQQNTSSQISSLGALIHTKSKVNLICDHLREIFLRLDANYYTLCILTTYVKKTPPDLQAALTMIKKLKEESKTSNKYIAFVTPSSSYSVVAPSSSKGSKENKSLGVFAGAEGALKYIIFLCDAVALYQVALGMYDQELVMMIAQYAQMDPKEYLPFLSSLFSLSATPHYMHYTIDLYLKKFDKAVIAMIAAIDVGEVNATEKWPKLLAMISEKGLWDCALAVTTPNELPVDQERHPRRKEQIEQWGSVQYDIGTKIGRYSSLLNGYAAHLRNIKKPAEAAAAYIVCQDYDAALTAYKQAGDFRAALSLAYSLSFSPRAIHTLAYTFVQLLREHSSHGRDAARLLLEIDEDEDEALVILCHAEDWEEAIRVAYSRGRGDLVSSLVFPELEKAAEGFIKNLRKRSEKYQQAVKRLRIVRRAKLMFNVNRGDGMGGDAAAGDDDRDQLDDDLVSIVSGVSGRESSAASVISGMTGLTTASITSSMSTSSIFSVPSLSSSSASSPQTADERRIARHAARVKRKQSKRRVKEGSIGEEAALIGLIRDMRLTDAFKEKCASTIQILIQSAFHCELAIQIQQLMNSMLLIQKQEESQSMPLMDNMTLEQQAALTKYWDWPQNVQREEKIEKDDQSFLLPFLRHVPEISVSQSKIQKGEQMKRSSGSNTSGNNNRKDVDSVRSNGSVTSTATDDGYEDDDSSMLGAMTF